MRVEKADLIVAAAQAWDTDFLVVQKRGEEVCRFAGPEAGMACDIMSITKSIVALAFGMVPDPYEIVTSRVSKWFPEWSKDVRDGITVEHLMTHTSGLQYPDERSIWGEPDSLEYALAGYPAVPPGTCFRYANEPLQVLSGILERVAGTSLSEFVVARLFDPLEIELTKWNSDSKGRAYAFSGIHILGPELVKIGRFVLGHGRIGAHQLVERKWIRTCMSACPYTPDYGLLWWRRARTRRGGRSVLYAHGWLGQFLVLCPQVRGLAVRLHRQDAGGGLDEDARAGFPTALRMFQEIFAG